MFNYSNSLWAAFMWAIRKSSLSPIAPNILNLIGSGFGITTNRITDGFDPLVMRVLVARATYCQTDAWREIVKCRKGLPHPSCIAFFLAAVLCLCPFCKTKTYIIISKFPHEKYDPDNLT